MPLASRIYIYIAVAASNFTLVINCYYYGLLGLLLDCMVTIFRRGSIRSKLSRALITNVTTEYNIKAKEEDKVIIGQEVVKVHITTSELLEMKPGQHVYIWIPGMNFWSFFQTHPFMITSWSEAKQPCFDLLIEPRDGFTKQLSTSAPSSHMVLFNGPFGISLPVDDYETVLMYADGFGIAAQLAYLKHLIYGYNTCKARTRRIHLVWQLANFGRGLSRSARI